MPTSTAHRPGRTERGSRSLVSRVANSPRARRAFRTLFPWVTSERLISSGIVKLPRHLQEPSPESEPSVTASPAGPGEAAPFDQEAPPERAGSTSQPERAAVPEPPDDGRLTEQMLRMNDAVAADIGVVPCVHQKDFIYWFCCMHPQLTLDRAINYYFRDGTTRRPSWWSWSPVSPI